MKRLPIAFLSVLAIALAGYSGFLNMENERLKHQLADASSMWEASMKIAEGKETETGAAVEEPRPEARERGGRFEEFENLTREEIAERRREARANMTRPAVAAHCGAAVGGAPVVLTLLRRALRAHCYM